MKHPLKFLVVSPTPTWPLDHGNRKRVHQICSTLKARGHEVHFVFYPAEEDWAHRLPHDSLVKMREQWNSVHIVAPTRPMQPPPRGKHHVLDEWWDPAIGDMLTWLMRVERFNAILVNYVWLSKALSFARPSMLKILDSHDRVGGRKELLASQGLAPEFFYLSDDEEAEGVARADLVLAIKDEESLHFQQICSSPHVLVLTLPYVELAHECVRAPRSDGLVRFGLIGASNALNRNSTADLIKSLQQRTMCEMPPLKVIISGNLSKDLHGWESNLVEVTGRVERLEDFYGSCDCTVVPLAQSTGQKIRIGEALAFHSPVIAHRHAFEGYVATHPFHALDSIDSVANAMLTLAADPSELDRLAEASEASRSALQDLVSLAFAALERRVCDKYVVTCFIADAGKLKGTGASSIRFAQALGAAADYGRTIAWIDASGSELASAMDRVRQWSSDATIAVSSEVWAVHGVMLAGTINSSKLITADTLEACLKSSKCDLLWIAPNQVGLGRAEAIIVDTDMDDAQSPDNIDGSSIVIGSRICSGGARATSRNKAMNSPFFLKAGQRLWRSRPLGRTIWIAAPPGITADLDEIITFVRGHGICNIWLWSDRENSPGEVFGDVRLAGRGVLGYGLDLPDLAVILHPRSLGDPLLFEILADAGARCVVLDPINFGRERRHGSEVGDTAELYSWLDLVFRAWKAGLENFSPGLVPAQPQADVKAFIDYARSQATVGPL